MITQEELKQLFDYESDTGNLFWKQRKKGRKRWGLAGTISTPKKGRLKYRQVMIDYRLYMAHQLIWCLLYGEWPNKLIDHIDGNGLNNSKDNLRLVTHTENGQNMYKHRNGKTPNVDLTSHLTWRARYSKKGKRYQKTFKSKEEAVAFVQEQGNND